MKISEQTLNELMTKDGVSFDAHERVPFFVVQPDTVITLNEVEQIVVDTFYTETHDNVIYVKMGSDHKSNGSFDGMEPSYSNPVEVQTLWAEQLGTAISPTAMMEIRRVGNMEPLEYRAMKIKEYHDKQNETYIEFYAPYGEQVLHFGVDSQKKFEILFQLDAMKFDNTKTLTLHDLDYANEEDFTLAEATMIVGSMMKSTLEKEFTEGAFIKRLLLLPDGFTKEDVDIAANPPLTEDEQAWIDNKVASKLS